jgi:hypothetical protein
LKSFRSLVVLKRPQKELWVVMRDHLVDFAKHIDDIESIRQIERSIDSNGIVRIVNEWRIRQQLPSAICTMLKIEEMGWIDRNIWNTDTGTCYWSIEPVFLREFISCSGETAFSTAMAGRGTRVTFAGDLDLKPGLLGSLAAIEPMVSGFIESIVTNIVPRNLRAVIEAAAAFELPREGP